MGVCPRSRGDFVFRNSWRGGLSIGGADEDGFVLRDVTLLGRPGGEIAGAEHAMLGDRTGAIHSARIRGRNQAVLGRSGGTGKRKLEQWCLCTPRTDVGAGAAGRVFFTPRVESREDVEFLAEVTCVIFFAAFGL